jgi:hypothetical protein
MSEMLGTFFKYLFALLGVAAVVAVLSQVVGSNKDGLFVSQLTQLVGNIEQLYAGGYSYSGIATANLVTAQAFPSGMVVGTTPTNPWNGQVIVTPNAGAATSFDITTSLVPQADCAKIVTSITTWTSLNVNGSMSNQQAGGDGAGANPGVYAALCNTPSNTIIFTFQG